MMQGDDIRNHRRQAESDATNVAYDDASHLRLALWVIAEQLYEIRQLISISLERKK